MSNYSSETRDHAEDMLAPPPSLTQALADAKAENTRLRDRVRRDTEWFECLAALIPLLVTHLQSVAQKTETSVLELGARFNHISQQVQQAGAQSEALRTDIAQIVMATQFQDFTRQKIEYVTAALRTVQARSPRRDPSMGGACAGLAWPAEALDALERLDAGELVSVGSAEDVTLF